MKLTRIFLSVLFSITVASSLFASEKVVKLTSLEWPPYTGEKLTEFGASAAVAKAAFKAMGYELQIDFYPWARTLKLAKTAKYHGYFPEYYAESIEKEFIFSDVMGDSPLGFAQNSNAPLTWKSIEDLNKVDKIGTVRGYVNTAEFDQKVAKGEIKAEPAVDDAINLRKLTKKRLNLAVIDKNVMNYLLNTDTHLKKEKDKITFNEKLLEMKKLYICFQKSDKGRELNKIFNEGLKKIDVKKTMEDYFKKHLK